MLDCFCLLLVLLLLLLSPCVPSSPAAGRFTLDRFRALGSQKVTLRSKAKPLMMGLLGTGHLCFDCQVPPSTGNQKRTDELLGPLLLFAAIQKGAKCRVRLGHGRHLSMGTGPSGPAPRTLPLYRGGLSMRNMAPLVCSTVTSEGLGETIPTLVLRRQEAHVTIT